MTMPDPTTAPTSLRVDAGRLRTRFDALARIGATAAGGVHRPAFSDAHRAARAWFAETATAAGLDAYVDGAGNHSGRLMCGPPEAPTLLLGSHLDSVPNGGRYDGALGVLCALEVVETIRDAGLRLPVHLEAIDFTDEEGTWLPLLGSRALAGQLRPADVAQPQGGADAFADALATAGLTPEGLLGAARPPDALAGYLEVHIEQGTRLEAVGMPVGIVTSIVGIDRWHVTFTGRADHAGTVSMADRRDAALGAAAFTLAAREVVLSNFPEAVANVGRVDLAPGAFNVVPETARVWLEARTPSAERLAALGEQLMQAAREQAVRFGLRFSVEPIGGVAPTPMASEAQQALREAAEALGLGAPELTSGAGHDAQALAAVCPAGMLFVPSTAGRSHTPEEHTPWAACVDGANVLLQAALRMAGAES